MNLELTKEEATVLRQLLDLACKAGGLQVAVAAITLASRIDIAMMAKPTQAEAPPE